jgi:hypothetical protein
MKISKVNAYTPGMRSITLVYLPYYFLRLEAFDAELETALAELGGIDCLSSF